MNGNRDPATTQQVESRPSPAFRYLHWMLSALAALFLAIGLFHLRSEALWYFSASIATAVVTANLVRLLLEQGRNRRAWTQARSDHWPQAAELHDLTST